MDDTGEESTAWTVAKLVGVFVVALALIQGFEFLREGVAAGTVPLAAAAAGVLVIVALAVAWHRFGSA